MQTLPLSADLFWTGALDPSLRVFDIIMQTEFGTTYNAYLLRGTEATALFETVKPAFGDAYFDALATLTDLSAIRYLVVSHTEPDHSGSIERLLDLVPDLTIVGTTAAVNFLRQIVNRGFTARIVSEGDTLSLGNKTLRFFPLPNLHWPDTMFTYIEEEKALVTCDAFGAHYAHPGVLRSTLPQAREADYLSAAQYYFDNILGPFKRPFMEKALDRVKDLELATILTGHGPVLDSHIPALLDLYGQWCAAPARGGKRVVIPYVSAYGYTKALAAAIAEGVRAEGVEARLYDMVTESQEEVVAAMNEADGLLFGTPTILGDALAPIYALTLRLNAPVHGGMPAGAFGSYGWSGEGVPHLIERLRQIKLKVETEGFRVRFKPTDQDLRAAVDYGRVFARSLSPQ